jgi:hypothetical protein
VSTPGGLGTQVENAAGIERTGGVEDPHWIWCMRCERCYRISEARPVLISSGVFYLCAYADCFGALYRDGWIYDALRHMPGSTWPQAPERGERYSLPPGEA